MRPVEKGVSPYTSIKDYTEAFPHLERRLGCYCSYCEMSIAHVPEVEHCTAKSRSGSLTDWDNLLLSCKYCNSRKGTIIGDDPPSRWVWPDKDNTFLAFTYVKGFPQINYDYLKSFAPAVLKKIENVYWDLALGHIPTPKEKDRRYIGRTTAFNKAGESLAGWLRIKGSVNEYDYKRTICNLATSAGFFSVWMHVFQDEPIIRCALIDEFLGTAKDCFDADGCPCPRPNGTL